MQSRNATLSDAVSRGVQRLLAEANCDLLLLDVNAPSSSYRQALALVRGYRCLHVCGALAPALHDTAIKSSDELARFLVRSAAAATRCAERIAPLPRALASELFALALELDVDANVVVAHLCDASARWSPDVNAAGGQVIDTNDSAGAAFYEAFGDALQHHMIERASSRVTRAIVARCVDRVALARRAVVDAINAASALHDAQKRRKFVRAL